MGDPAKRCLAGALLISMVLVVFWRVGGHSFIFYDDKLYVSENYTVRQGLTLDGVRWAFAGSHVSNWHPLTWLSHMADVEIFGRDAGWHHRVNVMFHGLNTVLLFWVFREMTGATWRSFFLAALFAVHPLHVESVAWVAERKDVLSTLFGFSAMASYVLYVRRPGTARYLAVFSLMALGLMSKPTPVTLPFVLLLLDYWPLGRFPEQVSPAHPPYLRVLYRLLREKLPLFGLSLASSLVTFFAQRQGESVVPLEALPPGIRVANALVSYAKYIGKTFWPVDLAIFYPHPGTLGGGIPIWQIAGSVAVLSMITGLALRDASRRPYLLTGWLWYVGTLVPMIGIVQVGMHSIADRYTYVPLIGLFLMVAWGIAEACVRRRFHPHVLSGLACTVILSLGILGLKQVGVWKDSVTLFTHALRVTRGNWVAHNNLGATFLEQGRLDEAAKEFKEVLRIKRQPPYTTLNNLGIVYKMKGNPDKAIEYFRLASFVNPRSAEVRFNLATTQMERDGSQSGMEGFYETLKDMPDSPEIRFRMALLLSQQGRTEDAIAQYRLAIQMNPDYPEAHYNLGILLGNRGDVQEAEMHMRRSRERKDAGTPVKGQGGAGR